MQRSDRLKEPPIIGQYYLVPAILWNRHAPSCHSPVDEIAILDNLQNSKGAKWWPVWGSKHSDVEHFNFKVLHYHVDPRFLHQHHQRDIFEYQGSKLHTIQASPLNHKELISGPPKPTLQRMRCSSAHSEWGHANKKPTIDMNIAFAGHQCRKGKRGFVCPHKLFPLGSVEPVNGVVTCPLHGMRVDAETGVCLGSSKASTTT